MRSKGKSKGRAYLVKQLRRLGVGRRLAVEILDLVFGEMKKALAQGEEVEFPFGKLKRIPFEKYRDAAEAGPASRRRYKVKWLLDDGGDLLSDEELGAGSGGKGACAAARNVAAQASKSEVGPNAGAARECDEDHFWHIVDPEKSFVNPILERAFAAQNRGLIGK